MSSDQRALHGLTLLRYPIMVNLPNGTQVKVTHKGNLQIAKDLILRDVLLVPNFKFNMLSIKKLCKQLKCTVEFTETLCLLQAPFLRKPLAIGKDYKGLYILDKEVIQGADILSTDRHSTNHTRPKNTCSKLSSICNNVVRSASSIGFDIWHKRLGHLSCNRMKTISDLDILQHDHFICEICPEAKQHRLPFPTKRSVSHSDFELIHVDT